LKNQLPALFAPKSLSGGFFMNIKKLLFTAGLALFVASAQAARLVKIINNSPETASFSYLTNNFNVHSGHSKNLLVEIPFTSRQKNLFDFIADQPYLPSDTLEIVTLDGTFNVWRDERGIIVAKAFVRGMSRQEAFPAVGLSLSQQEINRVIGCVVTINNTGLLSIEKS
jgi:hypothetical protein